MICQFFILRFIKHKNTATSADIATTPISDDSHCFRIQHTTQVILKIHSYLNDKNNRSKSNKLKFKRLHRIFMVLKLLLKHSKQK